MGGLRGIGGNFIKVGTEGGGAFEMGFFKNVLFALISS